MNVYCLMHHHGNGSDAYLFQAEHTIDPGEAAARLGVDFCLGCGETVDVAPVINMPWRIEKQILDFLESRRNQ